MLEWTFDANVIKIRHNGEKINFFITDKGSLYLLSTDEWLKKFTWIINGSIKTADFTDANNLALLNLTDGFVQDREKEMIDDM